MVPQGSGRLDTRGRDMPVGRITIVMPKGEDHAGCWLYIDQWNESTIVEVDGKSLRLTHLSKVMFPDDPVVSEGI